MMKANASMDLGRGASMLNEPHQEQREVPRTLENMAELISEIEQKLEYLETEIAPVLLPVSVKEEKLMRPADPLGSPLAMTLDVLNSRLFHVRRILLELTSRVQL